MSDNLPAIERSPAALMMVAIEKGLDLEKVSQAMDLQAKWEANQARKSFHAAKASFKAEMPTVYKDKKNPKYNSMYVSGGNLTTTVNPILGQHGLEISFDIIQAPDTGMITVTAILTHEQGHSERVSMSAPPDDGGLSAKGNPLRNPVQAIKSTRTYLMVATYELILGIIGSDDTGDDDGNTAGSGPEYITPEQVKEFNDLIYRSGRDPKSVLNYAKAESPEKILAEHWLEGKRIKPFLEKAVSEKAKPKKEREPGEEG